MRNHSERNVGMGWVAKAPPWARPQGTDVSPDVGRGRAARARPQTLWLSSSALGARESPRTWGARGFNRHSAVRRPPGLSLGKLRTTGVKEACWGLAAH